MIVHVRQPEVCGPHSLHLTFSDGTNKGVDILPLLQGPIFEPLRDVEAFRCFRLHPELRTLVWPNGADLAPEFLREKLRVVA